jgi:hypothetical protein
MTRLETAENLVKTLKTMIDDRSFRPHIWAKGDHVRIYTGPRNEYISIEADGSLTTSQTNISWGHIIREVM